MSMPMSILLLLKRYYSRYWLIPLIYNEKGNKPGYAMTEELWWWEILVSWRGLKRKGEGSINGSNAMNPKISSQAVPWLFSQIIRFIAETIVVVHFMHITIRQDMHISNKQKSRGNNYDSKYLKQINASKIS